MARRKEDGLNSRKKEPRNRLWPMKVFVTDDERSRIEERAKATGLSISTYLRTAGLGHPIKSVIDHAAVMDLAKVNGDQGRLGGLLKLWLVDRPGRGDPRSRCAAFWSASASCRDGSPMSSAGFDREADHEPAGRCRISPPRAVSLERETGAPAGRPGELDPA